MQLTKNFTLEELTKTSAGLANNPTKEQINSLSNLAIHILQPLRDYFKTPIIITSGFRSQEVNEKVGGSKTSQHTKGEAVDINLGNKNKELFNYVKDNLEFDQMIWEFGTDLNPNWVHISYVKGKNRKQILKAVKKNGKTVYINY